PRDSMRALRREIKGRRRVCRARERDARAPRCLREGDNVMLERRPALGKGLSALIPDVPEPVRPGVLEVDVDRLSPNDHQPRLQMDDAKLDELAASIKANGVIQPILGRRSGGGYQIIAGERRWGAAQRAGLRTVPVVVREVSAGDKQVLELALIENLQREGLNPVDEALAYQRLPPALS